MLDLIIGIVAPCAPAFRIHPLSIPVSEPITSPLVMLAFAVSKRFVATASNVAPNSLQKAFGIFKLSGSPTLDAK